MLRFDWEDVETEPVSAILGRNERRMDDGSLSWDAVAFVVAGRAVLLTVDADSDEIIVTHEALPVGDDWHTATSLSRFAGRPLGWCWIGKNYRGYADAFTLAFGDIVPDALQPRLMFVGVGAALTCYDVTPMG